MELQYQRSETNSSSYISDYGNNQMAIRNSRCVEANNWWCRLLRLLALFVGVRWKKLTDQKSIISFAKFSKTKVPALYTVTKNGTRFDSILCKFPKITSPTNPH